MRQHIKTAAMMFTILMILMGGNVPTYAEVGLGIKGGMLIPDQEPFKDYFDSNVLVGGVLEFDSNMGPTVEANVEYYKGSGSGGDMTIIPLVLSLKYNFFPRYRTTPFVGIGIGTYFFDQDYKGKSTTKTRYGTRVSGGVRFLQDRQINLVFEAARNFTDFNDLNASSFQFTVSVIFDFTPTVISAP